MPWFAVSLLTTAVSGAWAQSAPVAPQAAASAPQQAEAAPAAQQAASGAGGPPRLETVVVTAQKRAEPAQSVPVSLFAVKAKQLEEAGVSGVEQLDQLAAGVTVSAPSPGQLNITMRGIGNLGGGLLAGSSTGYYIDETPMSAFSQLMPQVTFWDAERVEVLRGPQGTLFGEGSMGGTLRVLTAKPDASDLYGRAQIIGSKISDGDSGYTARVMVNAPLIADELALRVTASHQDIIGWVDYPDLGVKDGNGGKQDDARIAARWTPTRELTLDFSYAYQRLDVNNGWATSPGRYQPSEVDPRMQPVRALSPHPSNFDLSNVTASYDFGFATLVGAASWFKQQRQVTDDLTPIATTFLGPAGAGGTITQFAKNLQVDVATQELRLVSNGSQALNWTAGIYHKDDKRLQDKSGFAISAPLMGIDNDVVSTTVSASAKAWAVFGDIDYKLTDTLSLQAGLRRFESDNDQLIRFDTTSLIFGTVAGQERFSSGSAADTSPKLGLSWKASPDVMLYSKIAYGFRDGGSNYQAPGYGEIPASYGPEKVRSIEFGIKSQPQRWLQVNASAYVNYWTDLQLSFLTNDGLFNFIQNAGQAKSTGGEIELLALPMAGLRLGLNLGAVSAKIDEDVFNSLGMQIATKGNRIPYSPEFQASASVGYDFALSGSLQASASAAYAYRSSTHSDPTNLEVLKNDSYDNLYLRFGVNAHSWGVAAFVSNATNSKATVTRSQFIGSPAVYGSYVQPRTYGVEVNASF